VSVHFVIESPQGVSGPIGLIRVYGDSDVGLDAFLNSLAPPAIPPGAARLVRLADGEQAVIARWSPIDAHVMPHAGVEVMRRVSRLLSDAGAAPAAATPAGTDTPLARLSDVLASAASPLAIDLLLDQPRRWSARNRVMVLPAHASRLRHLLRPPLVVAWGPPNIGKSSLLNALARRDLSIAAPVPGTTRDHVGALLNVNGLVTCYVDTPGMRSDPEPAEADAIEISRALAETADLLLWCQDATSSRPPLPPTRAAVLAVDLRSDLGVPLLNPGLSVTSRDERSVDALARAIRQSLVPDAALADPGAWDFWSP
jgi:hypothetical protein